MGAVGGEERQSQGESELARSSIGLDAGISGHFGDSLEDAESLAICRVRRGQVNGSTTIEEFALEYEIETYPENG